MRAIKSCFVCEDHLPLQHYCRDEVESAIQLLKARLPAALLTVADLVAVRDMMDPANEENEDGSREWVQRAEDHSTGGESTAFFTNNEREVIQQHFEIRSLH